MPNELRHLLHGLDVTTIRALEQWWNDHLIEIRVARETAEASERRRAELRSRLDHWRALQRPRLAKRAVQIMRLHRRGLGDDEIGAYVGLSDRQVRRVIKKELRR